MQTTLPPSLSHRLANMSLLCAALVAACHVHFTAAEGSVGWWVKKLLPEGVETIPVPFFFMAAGFLLAGRMGTDGWWPRETRKRVRSLLLPYFIWNAIALVSTLAMDAALGRFPSPNCPATLSAWADAFGVMPWGESAMGIAWFLKALFLCVVASPVAYGLATGGSLRVGLGLGLLFGAYWFTDVMVYGEGKGEFFLHTFSLMGLFWFTLGVAARRRAWRLPLGKAGALAALAMGVLCFAWSHGWRGGLGLVQILGVALTLAGVWRLVPERAWPRELTALAFPLYLLHMFFVSGIETVWGWGASAWAYMGRSVLAIAGALLCAFLLRRLFPRVSTYLFGGR